MVGHHNGARSRSGSRRAHHLRQPADDPRDPPAGRAVPGNSLDGQVKVAVNRLLSGLDARLYDATGKLRGHPRVARQSLVTTKFELTLDDAFARRTLSPHQQLHFDEVIPAETRIDDIMMALKNLGFKVRTTSGLIRARRNDGSSPSALKGQTRCSSCSTWRASSTSRGASGPFPVA